MNNPMAWGVAVSVGVVGTLALFFLTRGIVTHWFRNLLRWLPCVLLLVPAPVPGHSGHFAPAFIVGIFEGLFQAEGRPAGAFTILITAMVLAVALIVLGSRLANSRKSGEN